MFSPPLWSSLKTVLKPRRKDTRIEVLLKPLAQALPCGSVGPLVGQLPIEKTWIWLRDGEGGSSLIGPCPLLSTYGTLSRIALAWTSEGWVSVPRFSPSTYSAQNDNCSQRGAQL